MAMLNVREFGRCRSGEPLDCIDSSIVSAVRHSPEIPQLQDEQIPHEKGTKGGETMRNARLLYVCQLNDATTYRLAPVNPFRFAPTFGVKLLGIGVESFLQW